MPEYLAPGVYIEETSFRSKSIEGVSTTTTGFIGPTRYGPIELEPDIVTSLGEFERVYGNGEPLSFTAEGQPDEVVPNYMWHATRAFFEEGGKRLYVARVFPEDAVAGAAANVAIEAEGTEVAMAIRARFPGVQGNVRVRLSLRWGPNILGRSGTRPTLGAIGDGDIVWMSGATTLNPVPEGGPAAPAPVNSAPYRATRVFDQASGQQVWRFRSRAGEFALADNQANGSELRVLTLSVTVWSSPAGGESTTWDGLSFSSDHVGASGLKDGIDQLFVDQPANLALARTLPIVVDVANADPALGGLDVAELILANLPEATAFAAAGAADFGETRNAIDRVLAGGNDGPRPGVAEYEGKADDDTTVKTGLKAFEDIEDISIVAAPGASHTLNETAQAIQGLLLSHAQEMRYRIAVLDSGKAQSVAEVRQQRGKIDSKYGALYYPWVKVMDPITRQPIDLPPSGFVAGIYARNDIERAVYKAPANEVVNLAIGFEQLLNKSQQDVLNPEGINCFRYFEGRGYRLWGARTVSSDPEWKYVNLRRYFAYLERSIDRGTQWVVFEPNGERLWANVRRTIEDFLFNEWQNGALLGDKPERAYFVKCDRSTMTQNDLDNGRLVCQVGVAALRPAEFVIFRIGQWTGDRRS